MAIAIGTAVFCVIPVAVIVSASGRPSPVRLVTRRIGIRGARHRPISAEE